MTCTECAWRVSSLYTYHAWYRVVVWLSVGRPMDRVAASAIVALSVSSLCIVCAIVSGCSASASPAAADDTQAMVSEALQTNHLDASDVAAVVNGTVITQDEVDEVVATEKKRLGLTTPSDFQSYLDAQSMTEWDFRAGVIDNLIDNVLLDAAAADHDVEISDSEVQAAVDEVESLYPSYSSFVIAISNSGFTEKSYAAAMRAQMLRSRLRDVVIPEPEPTSEQIGRYARTMLAGVATKRSSFILLGQADYNLACEVAAKLEQGEDFAELAREYSVDQNASEGGDAGWDFLNTNSTEYQAALDELAPGETSDIVRTRFGYYIIKCTGFYEPQVDENGDIDLSDVPSDIMDSIKQNLRESLRSQLFELYVNNLEASSTIAVFDEKGQQVVDLADAGLATEQVFNPTVEDVIDEVQEEAASSDE